MTVAQEDLIRSGKSIEIPHSLQDWLDQPKGNFIDGRWELGHEFFPTVNPANEKVLSKISLADKSAVDRAVGAARRAFEDGAWSFKRSLAERARVMRQIAELIDENRATLAILESLDTGKPIRESFDGDILRAAHNFRFFADFAESEEKPEFFLQGNNRHVAFREPLGVVGLITPWNLPLYLETWKLAPALLMGNSVCLKPSELTPLTSIYLGELLGQLDIPPGVVNILQGFGESSTGEFLTSHPDVDAISFTGETRTGSAIMRSAAGRPARVSFELGGKGSSVVFDDAPMDLALKETMRAAFRNQGEICLASPRIYVQQNVYEDFVARFTEKAGQIRVGPPLDYRTEMGALISREHEKKILAYLAKVEAPAKIILGGKRPAGAENGYFLSPTVVVGLGPEHPITREEIFGPVVAIYPFSSEEEVVRHVNDTPYGLSSSIWTKDEARAQRVAAEIRTGLVWINCWFVRDLRVPFGGMKRSGVGREGGTHSLDFFSEWKSVCTASLSDME